MGKTYHEPASAGGDGLVVTTQDCDIIRIGEIIHLLPGCPSLSTSKRIMNKIIRSGPQ